MFFVFQQSRIWDGSGDKPDPEQDKVRIKAKSIDKALKRLPKPSTGRKWVHVETEGGQV